MSRGKKSRSASRRSSARHPVLASKPLEPGQQAQAPGLTLRSYQLGAFATGQSNPGADAVGTALQRVSAGG